MKKVSVIGGYLKKIYRIYSNDLLNDLTDRGFIDLRPSFLEILMYLCEHQNPSIKEVGLYCGLKKQTMTSHLNELEKRTKSYFFCCLLVELVTVIVNLAFSSNS